MQFSQLFIHFYSCVFVASICSLLSPEPCNHCLYFPTFLILFHFIKWTTEWFRGVSRYSNVGVISSIRGHVDLKAYHLLWIFTIVAIVYTFRKQWKPTERINYKKITKANKSLMLISASWLGYTVKFSLSNAVSYFTLSNTLT